MNDQPELTRNINWLLRERYDGKMTEEAEKDIARLEQGEPVDYVIGWADFLGCGIDLSMRPFIPRPETEYWVGKAIEEMKEKEKGKVIRCLDLFSGSGCIGIALLSHLPNAIVDFAEKEKAPLTQIAINTTLNEIDPSRYRIIRSDMLSSLKKGERYDYIFANPPYIALTRKNGVQESVLAWEPHAALFGKDDGLYYIQLLLKEAKNYLKKEGTMYIEFDSPQKRKLTSLLRRYGYVNPRFFKDQYEKWRWAKIRQNVKFINIFSSILNFDFSSMRLIFIPLANSRSIKILLESGREQWEEIAENGEALVGALDKVFEIAKINLSSVTSIRVMNEEHSSLLSVYLAHTTKQALHIAKEFQSLRR